MQFNLVVSFLEEFFFKPHVSRLELLILTHSIPRMNVAKEREVNMTMFLEHTVMVKFPTRVISVNIKTTAMFCPNMNSG